MEKKLKNIQTFEQHTEKNLNISDVTESETKIIQIKNEYSDIDKQLKELHKKQNQYYEQRT